LEDVAPRSCHLRDRRCNDALAILARRDHPAHSAGRIASALRRSGRRQAPSRDLPRVRQDGRRGLATFRRYALRDCCRRLGYKIDEAAVIFWGTCPSVCTGVRGGETEHLQDEVSELRRPATNPTQEKSHVSIVTASKCHVMNGAAQRHAMPLACGTRSAWISLWP